MDCSKNYPICIFLLAISSLLPRLICSMLLINGTQPSCPLASACIQSCPASSVCPLLSCDAPHICKQNATNASLVADVLCASEECVQIMNYTIVNRMHAMALRVSQKFVDPVSRLGEMRCIGQNGTANNISSTAKNNTNITTITCTQSCDLCDNMSCNATRCSMISKNAILMHSLGNESTITCAECGSIQCYSNTSCSTACQKRCNNTICNSANCSMVCEPNSQCPSVSCGSRARSCNLDCRDQASCDLNCTASATCTHSCAETALCYTRFGELTDLHDGTCGTCNCSTNIRNCTQRCEGRGNRCLEMYCNAVGQCTQFSSNAKRSFIYRMRSYAPTIKQECHNKSDCWQMLCYGTHCSITCVNGAKCGYMICKATTCNFNCYNGSVCDVMTCLKGSHNCIYTCDGSSICRNKRCIGTNCIGAVRFAESNAGQAEASFIVFAMITFLMLYASTHNLHNLHN